MLQNWLKCNTLIKNRTFYLINSCRSIQGNLGLQRRFNHQAVSTASPLPYSVFALVKEYRRCGHFLSKLDPLNQDVTNLAEKETQSLRQSIQWMERCLAENHEVKVRSLRDQLQHLGGYEHISPERLLSHLKSLYSSEVGVQFDHLSDESERAWAYDNWETKYSQYLSSSPDASQTLNTAKLMLNCEAFDEFLALRFPSVKRYGCEGAESMLVFFDQLFTVAGQSTRYRQTDFVLAMPHRGRLNLLALQLNMSEELIFRKLMGHAEFDLSEMSQITGDVISHLFTSIDLNSLPVSNQVHVSLLPNPSHLEAISPVACGKSRARQKRLLSGPYSGERPSEIDVLPIQVHGDGSFSGQGIIFEELQFAHLPQYTNNGSIHLIVNNQIAYTMEGKCRDSSLRYPSNVMQAVDCPVLHVNGSKPHAIRCAVDFAIDYRNEFGKDVLIDLHCYRQHGHNELDDPTFTNPRLYDHIRGRQYTIPMEYAIEQACLSESEANTIKKVYKEKLDESLKRTKQNISNPSPTTNPTVKTLQNQWSNMRFPMAGQLTTWNTGLDPQLIQYLGLRSLDIPANFTLHKNLRRILFRDRRNKIRTGLNIDWSLAESLAFASLLYQGYDVRISGQDVGRGVLRTILIFISRLDDNCSNCFEFLRRNIFTASHGFGRSANGRDDHSSESIATKV